LKIDELSAAPLGNAVAKLPVPVRQPWRNSL
jgi:hypothetical protein